MNEPTVNIKVSVLQAALDAILDAYDNTGFNTTLIEPLRAALAAQPAQAAQEPVHCLITRPGCKYVVPCGKSCRKCGMVHFAHLLVAQNGPASQAPLAEWQPIETAPKDETDILVYCSHGQYVVSWTRPGSEWWHVDDNKHGPYALRGASPTHWMNLPVTPKEGAT